MASARRTQLSDELVSFLHHRIDTMTQLETLLALRRGARTAADVAGALRLTERHAAEELARLVSNRLATATDGHHAPAANQEMKLALNELEHLYPTYRVAIARAIFT